PQLVLAEAETLAERHRVGRDAALVILAVLVARLDRRGERADRGEIRVVELVIELDAAHLRRARPADDPEQLALLVGGDMQLAPGDDRDADEPVRRAQREHIGALVAEALETLAGGLRLALAVVHLYRLAARDHSRDG